ncbi:response regulator transcription factor [Flavobacterium aquicola]|uniref:DNA-binding NarL/FixJ family response regulator n=1 Tax=Flavobacterium aquicola TaxID=1682742 RepID=A0A3E0DWN7_9FLAO|nr:response regulator [Flavobacterium aquicola]REG90492.1 DNA-binding NarL/FixJ family response regulator [Flavobacterium aquicola]
MFKKVLIADDIDFNDIAAVQVLKDLKVPEIAYSKYCDDALLKIKRAYKDNEPYELLISDLSFKADYRENILNSGEELISAVKQLFPEIKIIIFSIEDKSYRIKSLFDKYGINGFVMKGRNSIAELKKAVEVTYQNNQKYLSPDLNYILQDKTVNEIDNYDIQLIKYLSKGVTQENMEATFKEAGITPNSKSTIEKRLNKLKMYFKANNPAHLVAIAKDLGLV